MKTFPYNHGEMLANLRKKQIEMQRWSHNMAGTNQYQDHSKPEDVKSDLSSGQSLENIGYSYLVNKQSNNSKTS